MAPDVPKVLIEHKDQQRTGDPGKF